MSEVKKIKVVNEMPFVAFRMTAEKKTALKIEAAKKKTSLQALLTEKVFGK
jgi:hypothetical protein